MSFAKIRWRPTARELRRFGVVVIIGLCLIGLYVQFAVDRSDIAYLVYAMAALLGLPALTGTVIALPGYWLWMGVAFVMAHITGRVLLTVVYYGLIMPMGIVRRLAKDSLRLRRQERESYWTDIESDDDPSRYERLF